MTIFQAIVLGVVQGLGEFLPISSSAHLVIVPWLFKWHYAGLTFDVALHLGTLVAVVLFFWRDWLELLNDGLRGRRTNEGRLFWFIALASIPGAVIGYLLEKQAETVFRTPVLIAVMLILMGVILYWADRRGRKRKNSRHITFADSMWIGFSQALAIIPGVSRSGITMTAGLLRGLSREAAARFSFLLSTPIIFGAGILKLKDLPLAAVDAPFIAGVITSAVVGFLSIKFLLSYLQNKGFGIFAWYRFILGGIIIVVALLR